MKTHRIFLVQTDTTVGFASQDLEKLNKIKDRPITQPCLKTVSTCKALKSISRVPKKHRRYVRYAKNTTFIYQNGEACRLVKDEVHGKFLERFEWLYSTSANLTKKGFELEYATKKADIIVEDKRGFFEDRASKMFKMGRIKKRRIR